MVYVMCSCGMLLSDKYAVFQAMKKDKIDKCVSNNDPTQIFLDPQFEVTFREELNNLLVTKICCRIRMLTYTDPDDE